MNTEKQPSNTTASLDDDFFVRNAVKCWLYYFKGNKWEHVYHKLLERETFNTTETHVATPRPARRRKPK